MKIRLSRHCICCSPAAHRLRERPRCFLRTLRRAGAREERGECEHSEAWVCGCSAPRQRFSGMQGRGGEAGGQTIGNSRGGQQASSRQRFRFMIRGRSAWRSHNFQIGQGIAVPHVSWRGQAGGKHSIAAGQRRCLQRRHPAPRARLLALAVPLRHRLPVPISGAPGIRRRTAAILPVLGC
jgi:hypothetical protein